MIRSAVGTAGERSTAPPVEGFHDGELLVQRRAGLASEAARLAGMLTGAKLDGGMSRFVADRDLAMITTRDAAGTLWTSPLYGRPGFCRAHGATLAAAERPLPTDPLRRLLPGEHAGMLLIDFHRRRRLRVNGTLARVDPNGFEIAADQAYGNCPQYIQQRQLHEDRAAHGAVRTVGHSDGLRPDHVAQIERADTFILGTSHPTRGADTSHRGGTPGFVRVEHGELWWPDYPGNNLFNSMGNIAENPEAALLFLDFGTGTSLQLAGRARLEWLPRGAPGDDAGTGRRVHFTPERIVRTQGLPFELLDERHYPRNPPLS